MGRCNISIFYVRCGLINSYKIVFTLLLQGDIKMPKPSFGACCKRRLSKIVLLRAHHHTSVLHHVGKGVMVYVVILPQHYIYYFSSSFLSLLLVCCANTTFGKMVLYEMSEILLKRSVNESLLVRTLIIPPNTSFHFTKVTAQVYTLVTVIVSPLGLGEGEEYSPRHAGYVSQQATNAGPQAEF